MLEKPKRGWWYPPGGKIETTETLLEAINREFHEETNLNLINPELKGVFNIIIWDGNKIVDEWMLFTFYANRFTGDLIKYNREGTLEWKNIAEIFHLPKALGDNVYLKEIIQTKKLITGKFEYTPNYDLISYSIDRELEPLNR